MKIDRWIGLLKTGVPFHPFLAFSSAAVRRCPTSVQIGNRFSYGLSQPIPHSHSHSHLRFPFQRTPSCILRVLFLQGRRVIPSSPPLPLFFSLHSPTLIILSPNPLSFSRKREAVFRREASFITPDVTRPTSADFSFDRPDIPGNQSEEDSLDNGHDTLAAPTRLIFPRILLLHTRLDREAPPCN